jgi:L-seryl-tRNA(Ser) seleniumtransferase
VTRSARRGAGGGDAAAVSGAGRALLRTLPSVERLVSLDEVARLAARIDREIVVESAREVLAAERDAILAGRAVPPAPAAALAARVVQRVLALREGGLRPVINATGTLLHTNLGRARVPAEAAEFARTVAASTVDLEIDLDTGKRGNRYKGLSRLLAALSGGEDCLAVNNNAAAVLLAINTLAAGRAVVVSRGELVEIGGSFRIPDIVRAAGARLVEVGTTNRTRPADYEAAIGPETGLLLKTHTSNYRVVGFTRSVSTAELVALGRRHRVPVYEDLGSGSLRDLSRYGLTREPTVTEVLASGVDLVSFSTDKLLGGPQGGVLAGRARVVRQLKSNPMLRALRIDKVTMAMLEKTLQIYLVPQDVEARIPFYRAIARSPDQVRAEAEAFVAALELRRLRARVVRSWSRIGGGACPTDRLETAAVALEMPGEPAQRLAAILRTGQPPVLGRIHAEQVFLDFRTIFPEDHDPLALALRAVDQGGASGAAPRAPARGEVP